MQVTCEIFYGMPLESAAWPLFIFKNTPCIGLSVAVTTGLIPVASRTGATLLTAIC